MDRDERSDPRPVLRESLRSCPRDEELRAVREALDVLNPTLRACGAEARVGEVQQEGDRAALGVSLDDLREPLPLVIVERVPSRVVAREV